MKIGPDFLDLWYRDQFIPRACFLFQISIRSSVFIRFILNDPSFGLAPLLVAVSFCITNGFH